MEWKFLSGYLVKYYIKVLKIKNTKKWKMEPNFVGKKWNEQMSRLGLILKTPRLKKTLKNAEDTRGASGVVWGSSFEG